MLEKMRRLHSRGAASRGVCVDVDGAMLGPDCVLVRRMSDGGYRSLDQGAASLLQEAVFDDDREIDWLFRQTNRIANALGRGEIALAQICGLYIPTGELDDRQLAKLSSARRLTKSGYNPDEPRVPKDDPHGGEWTTGSVGEAGNEAGGDVAPAGPFAIDAMTVSGDGAGTSGADASGATNSGTAPSGDDTAGSEPPASTAALQ